MLSRPRDDAATTPRRRRDDDATTPRRDAATTTRWRRAAATTPRPDRDLAAPPGDLLDAKKVKRAYYKASRSVHPDKLVNLPVEQRFVGKRVFDALSQAYAEFEESGMG